MRLRNVWRPLLPSHWVCVSWKFSLIWLEASGTFPCVPEFFFSGWFEWLFMKYIYGSFHVKRLGLFALSSRRNLHPETIRVTEVKGQGASLGKIKQNIEVFFLFSACLGGTFCWPQVSRLRVVLSDREDSSLGTSHPFKFYSSFY